MAAGYKSVGPLFAACSSCRSAASSTEISPLARAVILTKGWKQRVAELVRAPPRFTLAVKGLPVVRQLGQVPLELRDSHGPADDLAKGRPDVGGPEPPEAVTRGVGAREEHLLEEMSRLGLSVARLYSLNME